MANNEVFICYSHKNKEWLEKTRTHLHPLVRSGIIDLFDDTQIPYGGNLKQIIREKIYSAKIAIFLVSADFFASDFIDLEELPPLLAAAERNGAIALSIIISHCGFEDSFLSVYRAINQPSRPLLVMGEGERDKVFNDLAIFIKTILPTIPQSLKPPSIPERTTSPSQTNKIKIAEDHLLWGKFELAIQEATAILENEPNNADALIIRARANAFFYKTEDNYIRDAAQALISVKNRKDCVGLMQYSQALFLLGWNKLALEHIHKVIAEEFANTPVPETNQHLYNAVSLRMRIENALREYTDAIADADWLLSVNESDGQVWFRKGQAHLGFKDYEEVIRCENIAIKLIPDYWVIYDVRGEAYSRLNRVQDAFNDFSKVFDKAPWYNTTRKLKAAILTDSKRYTEALSEIAVALIYDPNDSHVLSMKAESLLSLGDYQNAKKAAEIALQHNPTNEFALRVLSEIETKNKEVSNANLPNQPKIPPLPIKKKSSIFDFIKKL